MTRSRCNAFSRGTYPRLPHKVSKDGRRRGRRGGKRGNAKMECVSRGACLLRERLQQTLPHSAVHGTDPPFESVEHKQHDSIAAAKNARGTTFASVVLLSTLVSHFPR